LNNDEIIYWDKKRKLTWDDFKGQPDAENPHAAISSVGFEFNYEYENDERKTKIKVTFKDINVKTIFNLSISWVRQERLNTDLVSSTLLNHEQGHFDLAYEFSLTVQQEMRDKLQDSYFSVRGKNKEQQTKSFFKERNKITNPIIGNLRKEHVEIIQKKYEDETRRGTILSKQNEYDQRFSKLRN